jgi:hypothetical protein
MDFHGFILDFHTGTLSLIGGLFNARSNLNLYLLIVPEETKQASAADD